MTIPAELNEFCRYDPRFCYGLIFRAAWKTLDTFARDPKWLSTFGKLSGAARAGATMVLHTWGQNLSLHPHVHAIVPTGSLDQQGQWVNPRRSGQKSGFLFPVKAMSRVFKAIYLREFMRAWEQGKINLPPGAPTKTKDITRWRRARYRQAWVVYAKAPFAGPESVIEYLGRYTHKTAISNHRLLDLEGGKVTFRYKDYRDGNKKKSMALAGVEFIRRFCLHILPPGCASRLPLAVRRIRHYGILSNYHKTKALATDRASLGVDPATVPEKKPRAERVRKLIEDFLGRPINTVPTAALKTVSSASSYRLTAVRHPPCSSRRLWFSQLPSGGPGGLCPVSSF